MMNLGQHKLIYFALAGLLVCCLPWVASAGLVNIILSDADVTYSASTGAGAIFDVVAFPGRDMTPLDDELSDPISAADFELDGGPPPASGGNNTIMFGDDNMYLDLRIDGLGGPLPSGTLLNGTGANGDNFGIDWFTDSGNHLQMNIDVIDLLVSPAVFFFTGEVTSIVDQNLPFGLALDDSNMAMPIQISYTATLPAVAQASTLFMAGGSGALTISGPMVIPEPGVLQMMLLGLIGMGTVWAGRRNDSS